MRKSRYTEEQIIGVLRQVESGEKVKDVLAVVAVYHLLDLGYRPRV